MGLGDTFRDAGDFEQSNNQLEQDNDSKHAMRGSYWEAVSGFTKTYAKRAAQGAENQMEQFGSGVKQAVTHPMAGMPSGKDIAQGADQFVRGGVGGKYADKAMGENNPESNPEMYKDANPVLRAGGKLSEYFWGGMEQSMWGAATTGISQTLEPLTHWLPKELEPVVTGALTQGSLNAGATATMNKMGGAPTMKDVPQSLAFGALLGGGLGYLGKEDMQAVKVNQRLLADAAGPSFKQSAQQFSTVAKLIAAEERQHPGTMTQELAQFASGRKDNNAMAAKVRMMYKSNPEQFSTPLMKRVLARANGDSKPAFEVPKPGEIHNLFNQPDEKVATAAAAPTPNDIPRPEGLDNHLSQILSDRPNEVKGEKFKPETIASSRALSQMAMEGKLIPAHVQRGDQAQAVARGLFRVRTELKGAGKFQAAEEHFNKGHDWMVRARDLNHEEQLNEGKINVDDSEHTEQLREILHKGQPREASAGSPMKARMTKQMASRKRDARGRFC